MISTLGLLLNTRVAQARYLQYQAVHTLKTLFSKSYRLHQAAAPSIAVVLLCYFWPKLRRSLTALQAAREAHYFFQLPANQFFQKFAVLAVFQRQVLTSSIISKLQTMHQKRMNY